MQFRAGVDISDRFDVGSLKFDVDRKFERSRYALATGYDYEVKDEQY